MNTLLNELIETFEQLSTVYNELLEAAQKKQQYLISGNIEELEMILYQEKNMAEIAQLLEEKRQNIIHRYCKDSNIQGNTITMKSLMDRMDSSHSKKISNQIDKLTQSLKQLQDINEANANLTRYSLEITEDVMKIFCSTAFQYHVYQHSGKMRGNELSMVLIDTEI